MNDFLFAEKPSGFNSHRSDEGRRGFVEFLQEQIDGRLYVVSRLDQGTSGAMVFGRTPEAAQQLTELFSEHKVKKIYFFLSAAACAETSFTQSSHIEKMGGTFVSHSRKETNSKTRFQFVRTIGPYFLWQAQPVTGKPHQIRLHAQQKGIPVLGDHEHGGAPFYRLALHCHSLEFEWKNQKVFFQSNEPVWTRVEIVDRFLELRWSFAEAQQKRKQLMSEVPKSECFRLLHTESEIYKIDVFGPQIWVYRYQDSPMDEAERNFWTEVSINWDRPLLVKNMINRGQDPSGGDSWTCGDWKSPWIATENGLLFELHSNRGQSPGLFLDQRGNRQWVRTHSKGQRILNLFSYTSGFSVAAAAGGAQQVTSVDTSKSFLEWSRQNFRLNELPLESHEFWASDALFFLKGAIKKGRRFDGIICDPPSFGRSPEGVFRIEKDWEELLQLCLQVLEPGGFILFSTNFEKWSFADCLKKLSQAKFLKDLKIEKAPGTGLDFELSEEPILKSFLLS